jgi:hypothetical protein
MFFTNEFLRTCTLLVQVHVSRFNSRVDSMSLSSSESAQKRVFVVPGDVIVEHMPETGVLHVERSAHVVEDAVVATEAGYAMRDINGETLRVGVQNVTTRLYSPKKGDAVIGVRACTEVLSLRDSL